MRMTVSNIDLNDLVCNIMTFFYAAIKRLDGKEGLIRFSMVI